MWVAVALAFLSACIPLERRPLPQTLPSSLAGTAKQYVGATSLGPYKMGNVGFIRAAFAKQGVEVFDVPAAYDPDRSGIEMLYQFAALHGRFHTARRPAAGDVVFFGKTPRHAGIVTHVDDNGTAAVALGTRTRVVSLPMNLTTPHEGLPFNGRLLLVQAPTEPKLLGELFYIFARFSQ